MFPFQFESRKSAPFQYFLLMGSKREIERETLVVKMWLRISGGEENKGSFIRSFRPRLPDGAEFSENY